jgi:glycosyltransferase involved in cell wall biosynthesis
MKRVLFVQPSMQPPGGGNGVAAWMLQALSQEHRVTVLSWRPVEIEPINRFFGTRLRSGDFDTLVVPRGWRYLPDRLPVPATLLHLGLLMRYARRVSDGFDVLVGAHNEADYGRRSIQYIHYPTYIRPRPAVDLRWYHRSSAALKAYYAIADRFAAVSFARIQTNLTLANSDWTAARVKQFLGIDAQTLYPPVVGTNDGLAWTQRRPAFLAIGRISPEKEYERVFRILAHVRSSVPDLTLTVVGTADRHARVYYERLQALARQLGSWIEFQHDLSRDDVRALMRQYRYGIHGMREEHFGMAPAEMARAGMIVWVPHGGGQVEIVGGEPALCYDTEDNGAERIIEVLRQPAEQRRLRDLLVARSELFSAERFIASAQAIVRTFTE